MTDLPDLPASCPSLRVIGHVRSSRERPASTPIQSLRNEGEEARVVVLPEFVPGLDGLTEFDYAWTRADEVPSTQSGDDLYHCRPAPG